MKNKSIVWFRRDLRLSDHPALTAAATRGTIIPVFIHDDANAGEFQPGAASRWWLHHALAALNEQLDGRLNMLRGDSAPLLARLIQSTGATALHWNRCYEPWETARDTAVAQSIENMGVEVASHNGSLLWEPWEVAKADGTPYKVFTPFYQRGCAAAQPPRAPRPAPNKLDLAKRDPMSLELDDLAFLPNIRWDASLAAKWTIGEAAAKKRLKRFVSRGLDAYKLGRDFPARDTVSRLSPHLRFGEISPHQVWRAVADEHGENADHFRRELAWREFSYHLLHHFPTLPTENLNAKFDRFPWVDHPEHLSAWQRGQTGYPIVDAGMRELWQTGYMHNRVRMITASFLVKNLLTHWHHGEAWFWDTLVDADLANNSASWQWVAGCGADAAPYFRIFNPVTQGEKFDGDGEYTRKYVPELAHLPNKYLFKPWEAPDDVARSAGVELGSTYPRPIVNLKASRERALEAYAHVKNR